MKLASVGIDPDYIGFPANHVSVYDPIERDFTDYLIMWL